MDRESLLADLQSFESMRQQLLQAARTVQVQLLQNEGALAYIRSKISELDCCEASEDTKAE